jgi:hypothetical protein
MCRKANTWFSRREPSAHLMSHLNLSRLNGGQLKRVNSFKYLGHLVTDDLRDDADIDRERRALAIRGNMIARRFSRCTAQVKITLFRAYCIPVAYGCDTRSARSIHCGFNIMMRSGCCCGCRDTAAHLAYSRTRTSTVFMRRCAGAAPRRSAESATAATASWA